MSVIIRRRWYFAGVIETAAGHRRQTPWVSDRHLLWHACRTRAIEAGPGSRLLYVLRALPHERTHPCPIRGRADLTEVG